MKEKYETLSLAVLKDLAKARGIKGITGMKKAELIDRMLEEDKNVTNQKDQEEKKAPEKEKTEQTEKTNRQEQREQGQYANAQQETKQRRDAADNKEEYNSELDSGITADGILEVMPDGYGFIRCENYLPGEHDVYVSPSQIRRFGLKTGDILRGNTRIKTQGEKFSALLYITTINGMNPSVACKRRNFEDLTPIFPN